MTVQFPTQPTARTFARMFGMLLMSACILPATGQVPFVFDQGFRGENSDDQFGWSMDLSGDGLTLIVGAIDNIGGAGIPLPAGHARVYRNNYVVEVDSWSWSQLGADIDGTFSDEQSGYSVAVTTNGNTVAVGSPNRNRTRVFDRVGQNWVPRGNGFNLPNDENPQRAGHAVSLSGNGNILAVGGPGARKVWVADISAGPGMPQIYGTALQLPGTGAGSSVDLDETGNNLVIGAYRANTNRGEVYVYQRNGNTWTQRGQTLQGVNNNDEFGFDVSINNDGNTIAVGSKGWDTDPNNTTSEIGQTAIYDWDGSQWVQRGNAIEGSNILDQCGYAVSLSGNGNRIAVGYRASDLAFTGAGQVRVFDWTGTTWAQNGDPILGDDTDTYCGHSVGLSDDGAVLGVGLTRGSVIDPFGLWQGKAWIYEGACVGSPSPQSIQSCGPYTWIDGETYAASNNTATVVLQNASGCDSIVSLDLTITQVDAAIAQNGSLLSANNPNATYQWVDCANGNAPINGATAQTFMGMTGGSYAVEVTENGCTSLSECVSILNVGVPDTAAEQFGLFPNPVVDQLQISTSRTVEHLDLFDLTGKYLIGNSKQNSLDLAAISSGTYLVRVTLSGGEAFFSRVQKL
jgi:hypothetical protein